MYVEMPFQDIFQSQKMMKTSHHNCIFYFTHQEIEAIVTALLGFNEDVIGEKLLAESHPFAKKDQGSITKTKKMTMSKVSNDHMKSCIDSVLTGTEEKKPVTL